MVSRTKEMLQSASAVSFMYDFLCCHLLPQKNCGLQSDY